MGAPRYRCLTLLKISLKHPPFNKKAMCKISEIYLRVIKINIFEFFEENFKLKETK